MLVVIIDKEVDQKTGQVTEIVSHGVDSETGLYVPLPQTDPGFLGDLYYNRRIGEYVLKNT